MQSQQSIAAPMMTGKAIRVAMTIAGSDPGGGAGLQADLKTFAACGVYGYSALTAIIAQNSSRVAQVWPVEAATISAQIAILVEERRPDALKIGALATAANVIAVADAVRGRGLPAPVVDPVIAATSGTRLLDEAGATALCSSLLPLARIVTPNVPEAELLSGIPIDDSKAMRAAARAIRKLGPRAVLIKGGHLGRGPKGTQVTDLLFDGRRFIELSSSRIPGDGAHGTGCALSAAIAAYLAQGLDLETAVLQARSFLTRALRRSFTLGAGRPLLGHFAPR